MDRARADEILLSVCDGVSNRLRKSNQLGRTVTLRLRYGDFTSATRSHTVTEPTDSTKLIHSIGYRLLDAIWPELERKGCTKVGIAVSNLCSADAVQLAIPFGRTDHARLDSAIDHARERFGYAAVGRARLANGAGSPGTSTGQGFPGHPR